MLAKLLSSKPPSSYSAAASELHRRLNFKTDRVRVGDDGKVPVGSQRLSFEAPPRSNVIRCLRHDGDIFTSVRPPIQKPNPSFYSLAPSSNPFRFCSHTLFHF